MGLIFLLYCCHSNLLLLHFDLGTVSASSPLSRLDEQEQGYTIATIREVIAITRLLQEIELSRAECMSDWITSYILHRTSIKILW